jgi:CRP-like cAMP-binding protein
MSERIRKLKDDAARLIAKGKLQEALGAYEEAVKLDRKDLVSRQKYGDLLARVGRGVDAVREYQSIAGSYAAEGLLLKAMAVCKMLLQVDPSHTQTQQFLADLTTKRRGAGERIDVPTGKKSARDIRGAAPTLTTSAATKSVPPLSTPMASPIVAEVPTGRSQTPPALPGVAEQLGLDEEHDASDLIELDVPRQLDLDQIPLIPLFSELPRDAFVALTERMGFREAMAGEVVVREGAPADAMYVLIQGSVDVSRSIDGERVVLGRLGEGGFFGEMALLSSAPRTASVVAVDDVMLFEIPRALMLEMEQQHPSIGEVLRRFHKNRLITNLLKTSPIFAPFATTDKKAIIERFKSRTVEEGTYVLTRERPAEGLYVVLSGRCVVLDDDGGERHVAELGAGDVFGEMSMLWHQKTCASVRAASACILLRLAAADFQELIMTHPQMLEALSDLSARRNRDNHALRDAIDVLL